MQRYVVRPYVCPIVGPQQQTRCCRFSGGEDIDQLLHGRRLAAAACGGRIRAMPRYQRTQEDEHRLVF